MSYQNRLSQDTIKDLIRSEYGHFDTYQILSDTENGLVIRISTIDQDLILRVRSEDTAFYKDYKIWKYLGSELPIPKIYKIGQLDESHYYCFSEFITGIPINTYHGDNRDRLIYKSVEYLYNLHSIKPVNFDRYGDWGSKTNQYTMKTYLKNNMRELQNSLQNIPLSAEHRKFIDYHIDVFQSKIPYIDQSRSILHGDYGYTNILVEDDTITGILDWEHSIIGDWVFDISWLHLWGNPTYLEVAFDGAYPADWQDKRVIERILLFLSYHTLQSSKLFLKDVSTQNFSYLDRLYQSAVKELEKLVNTIH